MHSSEFKIFQVLNDRLLDTQDYLDQMHNIKNNDVVVLAHVQLKHTQGITDKNFPLFL